MRFHLGSIPETPEFTPDASWRAIREPTPWVMQALALPIGVAAAAIVMVLWLTVTPLEKLTGTLSVSLIVILFAGIVVVHELIHAAVHPKSGCSRQSILGVWPSRILFYAHYDGELTRNRFVAILLMPLVVMSLTPLLVAAVAQFTSSWPVYVSVFNALLACGDILGAGMVLFQIPASAVVRNQGLRTYWRRN